MRTLGMVLLVIGAGILFVYVGYYCVVGFVLNPEIPLPIRGAITAVILGLLLVLASLIRERYRDMKQERFRGVEE